MAPHRRGPWSPQEDMYLLQLVHTQGAHNWVRISQIIGSRSPKQCRERYHQNLKPTLNHSPITPEEGILIERLVSEMGKRWAEIARRLSGRSDNAVKNWWNGGMNRRRRLFTRRGDASRSEDEFDERAQSLSFARPAGLERSLTTRTLPLRRHNDSSLPSPSTLSELSRSDSTETAPSLVSDSASNQSCSPRIPGSPAIELPPLIGSRAETRRPSLPILHLGTNAFAMDTESQMPALSSRYDSERKSPLTPRPSPFRRPDLQIESFPYESQYMRRPAPVLSRQLQLPPIHSLTCSSTSTSPQESPSRDARMNLSNLLG
ncbi:MAG: hypothetical protein M1819_004832 [Sarea resinae]|nr:MAG: hypothetical protein M1819_004832 [Sarea resinae]